MNYTTNYITTKYKDKSYNLAMYVYWTIDDSDYDKLKFTIDKAGFQTKNSSISMGNISLTASFTNINGEVQKYSNKKKFDVKKESGANYVRERYLDPKSWNFTRKTTDRDVVINFKGNMLETRFSGLTLEYNLVLHIPALGKPSVTLTATQNTETSTSVDLELSISANDTLKVTRPDVRKFGIDALTCQWKYNGGDISFPHTMEKKSVKYKCTVANQITDILHDTVFRASVGVGAYSDITSSSVVPAVVQPKWYGQLIVESSDGNEYPYPAQNPDGTAKIKVFCSGHGEVTNENGWRTHKISSTKWAVDIELKEFYVHDSNPLNPPSVIAYSELQVQYEVPSTTSNGERQRAIFETSRNCGYTTGLANNIFIGGCKYENYKSRVWYSAVNNPTYIPDTNYIEVGTNDTSVMGLVTVGDYLGIIKQSKTTDSSVYLAYATSFDDETTFATKPCINGVGAIGEFCFNVLGDETLFLSPRGVMAIVPSEDEQSRIKNRSYYVDGALLSEPNLENAYSFVYNGMYYLFVNNKAYVLDGSQRNSWGNERTNLVYECYYLENVPVKCAVTFDEFLMFSDYGGNVCMFKDETDEEPYTDNGVPVKARWSTIADDDGALQYTKTMKKKGTLVSLLPEKNTTADVFVKKDEEEEKYIGQKEIGDGHTLPAEYFLKKKVKKYKRLQFIVEDSSANPFGIDKIVKAYSFGSYAKK